MSSPSKRKKKRDVSYGLWFSFPRTKDLYPIYYSCLPDRTYPPPPEDNCGCQISFLFRSCSDHARAEQEHRIDRVLLKPGTRFGQVQPRCGEGPLEDQLRRRERSEQEATGPHHSGIGWDDVPHMPFVKTKIDGKWEGHQWQIQREKEGRRNRISLAYGLTSNKDQTLIDESWFVFLLYVLLCNMKICYIFLNMSIFVPF